MEEKVFEGCICCMSSNDLCNLFAVDEENAGNYAKKLETCFDIKIPEQSKHICTDCVQKLEKAVDLKESLAKSLSMVQTIKGSFPDVEYLDESILSEDEVGSTQPKVQKVVIIRKPENMADNELDDAADGDGEGSSGECSPCVYCSLRSRADIRHALCLCADKRAARYQDMPSDSGNRQYPCYFCENVYATKRACFTHLRMKHGLKLCNEQPAKNQPRERKKCHICNRDFSQKQILNKHLERAHGCEVEKRKAFICPICDERVSYGTQFSEHLLKQHQVLEEIDQLEFRSMDDFMLFKSAIQETTKARFRKTTASKQTIEGVRSHYMCSQSGVYVYQGKGKRPAPERQIYKTGKACPAHMIVTETPDHVHVVFYKTHVGHGTCPYYEPRLARASPGGRRGEEELSWVCEACGRAFWCADKFRGHLAQHGLKMLACHYCDSVFQNVDDFTCHMQMEHELDALC